MQKERLRSKFLGCLLGVALGDALGAEPRVGWLSYTDDTHMTIGVAQSLVESQGFCPEHMLQTFIRNYEAEPWRGYGPGPPRIFQMLRAGEPWDRAASKLYDGGSLGNGAAMRVAPIGLLYSSSPAKLREVAYKSSMLTHYHELGKEGAAIEAYAVALATREVEPEVFISELHHFTQHPLYQQKIAGIKALLKEKDRAKVVSVLGNGVEALNSVPTAIYCFLKQPKSYKDCILYALSLGGDTDTIAAMAGAISGAYLGVEAIPSSWRARLENRHYIELLAEKLWQLAEHQLHFPEVG
ncbi:ADP-ribosylglycohydrolase family protein [Dehalococcoidales bacterium]|nr:ADP-ribosylglycohydrolase family protein [Dehalococcoidales bacterium]